MSREPTVRDLGILGLMAIPIVLLLIATPAGALVLGPIYELWDSLAQLVEIIFTGVRVTWGAIA